jgi:uncharacterized protein (TIGR00255 family)
MTAPGGGLSSMTGFARKDGAAGDWRWVWEIKTVNARGLEMRFRLAPGFDNLEVDLRKAAQKKLSRGALSANLIVQGDQAQARYRVNETALEEAVAQVEKIAARLKCDRPRAEGILALRGVMEPVDDDVSDHERKTLSAAVAKSFDECLEALAATRRAEGANVAAVLAELFDDAERIAKTAKTRAAAAPAALRERIAAQMRDLLAGAPLSEERLAQEAAMLALKADIREELDRLAAHIEAGRALLESDSPAGRQLDFLSQELNREANTLCAKAPDLEIKRLGLALKQIIDQLREQVQNVE